MRTIHLKTISTALGVLLATTLMAQQVDVARKDRPIRMLADGRKVTADELTVTLKESGARARSLDVTGNAHAVNRAELRQLHPQIIAVEARHTASAQWLNGEPIPKHLRKDDGTVPRIARNFTVVLRPGSDAATVRRELEQHPDVERVRFKEITELHSVPNDPNYASQWAPPITGLETAWDVPGRGRIRVAVVDTGVRLSHPEFAGRIVFQRGYADFAGGDAPAMGTGFDHGTHVAGIIGAVRNNSQGVAGYSQDIDLMVLNCATWDAATSTWRIGNAADAINDAVANGALVINCSFGFSEDVEEAVENAFDASVLVVHSAGNSSSTIDGHWEAGSIALFTVTATMTNGSPATDVFDASYSNFGPGVDIAAPGTLIFSTLPGGYGLKGGTSMAAPQVSGAAALIMSMNPTLIGDESARALLIRMALDKGAPGDDQQYGYGVLRLYQRVLKACRDATAFVSNASTFPGQTGNYDRPWHTLPAAIANVPNGATLVLNGGIERNPFYHYPAISINKPCTLSAIPDRPVVIGR